MLPGIGPELAHQIVVDRHHRGAFRSTDELVERGLLSVRGMTRIAPRLVCITPGLGRPDLPSPPPMRLY